MSKRVDQHRHAAKNGSGLPVHLAWVKYGEPACSVVAEVPDDELGPLEVRLIAELGTRSPGGYNLTAGGEMTEHHPDTLKKMGDRCRGRKYSDAHRLALSIAHKGLPSPKKGKPMSEEQKAKLKATWAKRKAQGMVSHMTPDVCERISQAMSGRTLSAETRAKCSAARLAYFERQRAAKASAHDSQLQLEES